MNINLNDEELWYMDYSKNKFLLLKEPRLVGTFYSENKYEWSIFTAPAVMNWDEVDDDGNVNLYALTFRGQADFMFLGAESASIVGKINADSFKKA